MALSSSPGLVINREGLTEKRSSVNGMMIQLTVDAETSPRNQVVMTPNLSSLQNYSGAMIVSPMLDFSFAVDFSSEEVLRPRRLVQNYCFDRSLRR